MLTGIIYHNISVGLYTNQHFFRHCLEWILDLFFGSCIKKCQQALTIALMHHSYENNRWVIIEMAVE
jgi:hypothetical protein